MQRTDVKPRAEVLTRGRRLADADARHQMLGGLGFENAYALAMAQKRADALGIRSIADLARAAPQLSIAGDYEFFARPEWRALRDPPTDWRSASSAQMQAEFMYPAVADGEVDVIAAYSSDGQIAKYELVVLDDPKAGDPALRRDPAGLAAAGQRPTLIAALTPLVGAIGVETMRAANLRAAQAAPERSPDADRALVVGADQSEALVLRSCRPARPA